MSKQAYVFQIKRLALADCRENGGMFFSADVIQDGKSLPVYIVAVSEHQAQQALCKYLMPLTKWNKARQDSEYIAELEAAIGDTKSSTATEAPAESADTDEDFFNNTTETPEDTDAVSN